MTNDVAHENALSGTAERLVQRLEDATPGLLFYCDADREEAVEIAAEEIATALASHPTTGQETVGPGETPWKNGAAGYAREATVIDTEQQAVEVCVTLEGRVDLIIHRANDGGTFDDMTARLSRDQAGLVVRALVESGAATPSPTQEPGTGETGERKSDAEIVGEVNRLAAFMLSIQGTGYVAPEGFKFYEAPKSNVRAVRAWLQAVEAYEMITATEVHDALLGLEDGATPATTAETRGPADQTKGGL